MNLWVRPLLVLVFSSAVAACSGGSSTVPLPQSRLPQEASLPLRRAIPFVPPVDLGRRAPQSRVDAVLLLRYNHQAQLDRFVDGLVTGRHPQYLTRKEFVDTYAPTPAQQQRVVDALRAAGIRVEKTYPNRTLLDVSAPTAAFEKYFATEMHDFAQGKYGTRYANVAPIGIPPEIAPYVAAVTARSVVAMHSDLVMAPPRRNAPPDLPNIVPPKQHDEPAIAPQAATNVVRNPGFETGHLKPWQTCDAKSTQNTASIQKVHPHGGRFDAYAGTYQGQSEPNGLTSVCQALTIPNGAILEAYSWGISNDRGVHQFGAIYDYATGNLIKTLWNDDQNNKNWTQHKVNLSAYAGDKVYLAFGVIGNSRHANKTIGQLVDDVSLTGTLGTPTPPPPATLACPTPSTNPTPTPSYASNDGWGPQSVQDGFCMPVNYGYDGTGQSAGIVIDSEIAPNDIDSYLQAFNVTRTGAISYVLVDNAPPNNDTEGEATLDLETIAALAPGANVVVYVTGDLSDPHIEHAYESVLTDNRHVSVVNSSFGACESPGAGGFDATVDSIAQQGAATGVTFSASSGDQGADCYNGSTTKYPFGVQGPASAPYFVGVGGTQSTVPFFTDYDICSSGSAVPATIVNPVVWSDCVGAGGGGISTEWHTPSYQSGLGKTTFRNVPDIALPSVEDAICFQGPCDPLIGPWTMIWGTSWSSPIYVAMQTEINEACGGPQWGIATMYNGFAASSYLHFIDVRHGNNQYLSPYAGSTKHYAAAAGFDQVSGIGIPLGMYLAADRCGVPAATHRR